MVLINNTFLDGTASKRKFSRNGWNAEHEKLKSYRGTHFIHGTQFLFAERIFYVRIFLRGTFFPGTLFFTERVPQHPCP